MAAGSEGVVGSLSTLRVVAHLKDGQIVNYILLDNELILSFPMTEAILNFAHSLFATTMQSMTLWPRVIVNVRVKMRPMAKQTEMSDSSLWIVAIVLFALTYRLDVLLRGRT